MRNTILVILYMFLVLLSFRFSVHANDIKVPIDHFPPFQVFPSDNGKPYGEVISVIEAIIANVNRSQNFSLTVRYTDSLPFARCLAMMKNGQADLIGGLLDKDDRKNYMHLFKYKTNSNKVFLLRKNYKQDISKIEDLRGQTVGTINGFVYFKDFDQDPKIIKDPVNNIMLVLKKLEHRRYNIAICSETEWQNFKKRDSEFASKFKTATFRYVQDNPVFIGISKKSWLSQPQYLNAIEQIVKEMYIKNEFQKIISDFYNSYTLQ